MPVNPLILPYPPSVNNYWHRNKNGGMRISKQGLDFRTEVMVILNNARFKKMEGELSVSILLQPPDRRKRDIDNVLKALLDALEHGGAFEDDNQIRRLKIERGDVVKGGKTYAAIRPYKKS